MNLWKQQKPQKLKTSKKDDGKSNQQPFDLCDSFTTNGFSMKMNM